MCWKEQVWESLLSEIYGSDDHLVSLFLAVCTFANVSHDFREKMFQILITHKAADQFCKLLYFQRLELHTRNKQVLES
ncbi:hypothetical protein IMY05_008G0031800 [Salix suchowensis]|nr:hypothetical protein IMY05_008G0031800 [Salix suchowensis]